MSAKSCKICWHEPKKEFLELSKDYYLSLQLLSMPLHISNQFCCIPVNMCATVGRMCHV